MWIWRSAGARALQLPEELVAMLDAKPLLAEAFDRLSFTTRREFAEGIGSAKRPETAARRIAALLAQLRPAGEAPSS